MIKLIAQYCGGEANWGDCHFLYCVGRWRVRLVAMVNHPRAVSLALPRLVRRGWGAICGRAGRATLPEWAVCDGRYFTASGESECGNVRGGWRLSLGYCPSRGR